MTTTEHIVRNAVQCRYCWDIIESRTNWGRVTCTCGNVAIEGGLDCLRRIFKNASEDGFIELSEYEYDASVP